MSVRSFRGENYLSVGGNCTIESASDIGEVAEVVEGEKGVVRKTVEGEIDGVLYSDEYFGCLACTAKVKSDDEILGECMKFGMLMKMSKCSKFLTPRVKVSGRDGKLYTLTTFHVISKIVDGIDRVAVRRKLLHAPVCRFNADKSDVVYSVQKV